MATKSLSRGGGSLLGLCLLLPHCASGYLYPLSDESVREAYFLGKSTERAKVIGFLAAYTHRFEPRHDGYPGVGVIEFQTPYEQVVLRSFEHQTTGYDAPQAQADYALQPQLVVRVFVFVGTIDAAPTNLYSDRGGRILDRREDFWRAFRFHVFQGRLIEAKRIVGRPVYSQRGRGLQGADVKLEFDAADFASMNTRVEVVAPDGQPAAAEFALDQLK